VVSIARLSTGDDGSWMVGDKKKVKKK